MKTIMQIINAVRELQRRCDAQDARIAELEAQARRAPKRANGRADAAVDPQG